MRFVEEGDEFSLLRREKVYLGFFAQVVVRRDANGDGEDKSDDQ